MYDTIILGSGPAGLTAAIYATRSLLNCAVLEQAAFSGGQMVNTDEIDNYPGFRSINGFDLASAMRNHAEVLGVVFITDKAERIQQAVDGWVVYAEQREYQAKTIIVATGARHRTLNVKGEQHFAGRGVSYCATCDGAFFRNKTVAVIGGGNTAVEDVLYLSNLCKKVYIIHRRDTLRAGKAISKRVLQRSNVEPVWNRRVVEILGDEYVYGLKLDNNTQLDVDGVFVAVGVVPNSEFAVDLIQMDEQGFIIAGEDGVTSAAGIFAAGDIRTTPLRQIITAAADGANAVTSVERYLAQG